ncbi:hypothetical protein [Leuconostoc lactis]|uniref:hypothetical protein n=1 Tax=Leuconostoc lactis TaxID=1246 RepID=UPI0006DCC25E|nr:hypothetical protein [Leuconostoc lactis]KQB82434.1 hypothetical protein AN225_02945 [Leuconostoc lactis]QEA48113.1 hypothetical protein FGL80_07885 [Leuconostoc lactis]
MLEFTLGFISLVIIVSAIGSFITLRPIFHTLTRKQQTWLTILFVAIVVSFLFNEIPDFIHGFKIGVETGHSAL